MFFLVRNDDYHNVLDCMFSTKIVFKDWENGRAISELYDYFSYNGMRLVHLNFWQHIDLDNDHNSEAEFEIIV